MVINLKDLSTALSQLNSLVSNERNIPGILFDIKDNIIDICFSNGNKAMIKTIEATFDETDIHDKIIFDYKMLTSVIAACEPVGLIRTDTIQMQFIEDNLIRVIAEKRIKIKSNQNSDEEEVSEKVASVVEQLINYVPASSASIKTAALTREIYDLMRHFDDEELEERFPDLSNPIRPLSTSEWDMQKDTWDVKELRDMLLKLSVENGKVMYVSPKLSKGFVQNTSHSISMPISSEVSNPVIIPTVLAKSIADILGKINEDVIYAHMVDQYKMVFSTEDNTFAFMVTNQKQDKAQIRAFNVSYSRDYSQYVLNFNKDVMLSCIKGAKTIGASDKTEVTFECTKESDEVTSVKMIMIAKNTNKSSNNKYEILAEHFICDEDITSIKLNIAVDTLLQAVNRISTDYLALDISIGAENKALRVAELDLVKYSEIKNKLAEEDIEWNNEKNLEARSNYLGCTTYFNA